jgi:hypothetical protein
MTEDDEGDRKLVDAGQEEGVVAAGRRAVAGLEMDDGRGDVALELRRQRRDLRLERLQGRVGGRSREIDRSQAAENGNQQLDRQRIPPPRVSRPSCDRPR